MQSNLRNFEARAKRVLMYRVSYDGRSMICRDIEQLETVMREDFADPADRQNVVITQAELSEEEFENLPEFEGW